MKTISIRGGGIAACCCTRLLRQAGFRVVAAQADRPKLPAIMLGETTQQLLLDVFESKELLADNFHPDAAWLDAHHVDLILLIRHVDGRVEFQLIPRTKESA